MTDQTAAPEGQSRPPLWRDTRFLQIVAQVLFVALLGWVLWSLYANLRDNLARLNMGTSFSFLGDRAGFEISGSDFERTETFLKAFMIGVGNTVAVAVTGIVIASVIGLIVGVGRLSNNWLIRRAATVYVEFFRNIPVLLVILLCYLGIFLQLPRYSEAMRVGDFLVMSVKGIIVPWITVEGELSVFGIVLGLGVLVAVAAAVWRTRVSKRMGKPHRRSLWVLGIILVSVIAGNLIGGTPLSITMPQAGERASAGGFRLSGEFAALTLALAVYTASHIAEVVRASILAVPRGQGEAADALGLSSRQRLNLVVLPQAMRTLIPPLANQYLNLTKNSSLAVAISFPEVSRVVYIAMGQQAPAPQSVVFLMGVYLTFSLIIALVTNIVNWRLGLKGLRR